MAVIGCAALAVGIFLLDLLIKNYMEKHLEEGETRPLCKGRLMIRKYHNRGAFPRAPGCSLNLVLHMFAQ